MPDIQRDLNSDGYVRGDFSSYAYARIELTPASLATIDVSGAGRDLILRVLGECRLRWRAAPSTDVTSTQLSAALGVGEAALKPWLLFLDYCEWKSGHTLSGPGEWSLRPNELILRYRNVDTWDDYLAVPGRGRGGPWLQADQLTKGSEQQAPPDLSLARGRLRRLLLHDQLAAVIESRLDEFDRVFSAQAWQAAMILLGSAMEGVLLDVLGRNVGKAESTLTNKKKRTLGEAGLGELIQAAETLNLVNGQVKALAAGLKEFRDLVHPNRAAASTWRPTPEGVRGCAVAFENLVVEMEQSIDDGRMKAFEQT